jgi:hypothetical protein
LEIPWSSDNPNVRYLDLKNHSELMQQVSEAIAYPELGSFLARINVPGFPLATAKCDAWPSSEVVPEEEIFGDRKFVSYIDLLFVDEESRRSFEKNEVFAKQLCRLLGHAPEIAATVELVIRHCYWLEGSAVSKDGGACGDSSAFEDSSAIENSSALKNSSEQSGTGPSMTEREQGMPLTNDEPTSPHAETHLLSHELCADIVEQEDIVEQAHIVEQADIPEAADIFEQTQTSFHGQPSDIAFHDRHVDAASYNKCARPTIHQESTRGFCMTAYVTGFGNRDHDPLRQWTIALNLLLHAIVQLNSNSQPKP